MPAKIISLKEAKQNKLFYFVANVVVYRQSDQRCLILQRSKNEKVHPNKYCVPGGKLEWSQLDPNNPTRINGNVLDYEDAIEKLLVRETKEEAGIQINTNLKYINSVAFIRPDGIPVVLVKFAAQYEKGKVKLEKNSFTNFAWVNENEVNDYQCIKGVPKEIKKTIALFSSDKRPAK